METQLLQNYSEAEKTAYLSSVAALATADRQASAPEAEFLQHLGKQANLSDDAIRQVLAAADDTNNQSIQRNLDVLKGSDLRFSLITDLISFARADGAYSNDEEAMVSKMASYLGVNAEQKATLESVVDQAANVPHDAQDPAKQGFLSGLGDKLSSVGIPKNALLAGLLGVVAPMVISRVMGSGGNSNSSAGYGQQPSGTMGGLLGGLLGGGSQGGGSSMGGLLGGLLGGGLLSSVLGGGANTSSYPQQGTMGNSGLGSIMSVLGGLGGQPNSQPRSAGGGGLSGSLGGLLGGLFGGR